MSAARGTAPAMGVKYHHRLVEKVLFAEIHNRARRREHALRDRYQELCEPLYALAPEERDGDFHAVNLLLFRECGLQHAFEEILRELVPPETVYDTLVLDTEGEEDADLVGDGERLRLMVRLRAESLLDAPRLRALLTHELAHVADMLDAEFGYDRSPLAATPIEESIVRERYRALWDIAIDSRLIEQGKPTVGTKTLRQREFSALYRKFGPQECAAVFEHLWSRERLTHAQLREYARDPRLLLRAAGIKAGHNAILPGLRCPVCGFPTYHWAPEPGRIGAAIIEHIRRDVPDWMPEQGLCERCLESWRCRVPEHAGDERRLGGG